MVSSTAFEALPFHEPHITTILIQSSFLLLLNVVNYILDTLTYCGLVGQIVLGILWGTPLGGFLDRPAEETIVQLGYLGLVLLVYEGGLSTSLKPLLSNLPLSLVVAFTGIALPIGLSFTLTPLAGATHLQSFVAGAALSATSLGTTFTILSSAGFANTRLGVVLTSAAMVDDVIGLVMIQVVSTLGGSSGGAIARPIGASIGLLILFLVGGWTAGKVFKGRTFGKLADTPAVVGHTLLLLASVTVAAYAGASVLFAAFLAGATVRWWDENAGEVFENYYGEVNKKILVPFFFASIGFSIPVKQMFTPSAVWKGIVYSVLMIVAKMGTGVWLLPLPKLRRKQEAVKEKVEEKLRSLPETAEQKEEAEIKDQLHAEISAASPISLSLSKSNTNPPNKEKEDNPKNQNTQLTSPSPQPPKSLYPAFILGLAMVARGEIAFLIASVAQSQGVFETNQELYLLVVWAAMVCTIAGPMAVGNLVGRVKALERKRAECVVAGGQGAENDGRGVLGAWGVG
ncbi:Sodium/hydrogen exchanger family-domain-containing protein [Pyronema omphalodes]|nr:Sodium/hydrogen exchanger family-domain-containing protein [Pyronema omphalodes]